MSEECYTAPSGVCQQQMLPSSYLPSSCTAVNALAAHAHTLVAHYLAQLGVFGLQGMPAHSGQCAAAPTREATPLWAASSIEESPSRSCSQDAAMRTPNLQPPSLQHEGFSERRWTQGVMAEVQAGHSEQAGSLPPTSSASSSLSAVRTESGEVLCLSKSACAARRALVRPQLIFLPFVLSRALCLVVKPTPRCSVFAGAVQVPREA